jgi:hypothetical protein
MRRTSPYFLPSTFELWCVGFATLALLIAGNAKLFLEHYGLLGSSEVVGKQLSNRFSSGLSLLDSLSLTPEVVTFLTWAVVGLVLFSIAQALRRASENVALTEQLGTDRYIHPDNFSRRGYWQHIAIDASVSLVLILLTLTATALYILLVVPVGFMYVQDFLLTLGLGQLVDLGLGLFVTYAGGIVLYLLTKVTVRHHQRTAQ